MWGGLIPLTYSEAHTGLVYMWTFPFTLVMRRQLYACMELHGTKGPPFVFGACVYKGLLNSLGRIKLLLSITFRKSFYLSLVKSKDCLGQKLEIFKIHNSKSFSPILCNSPPSNAVAPT